MNKIICPICHKTFFSYLSDKRKFCSRKCFINHRKTIIGFKHNRWKGGKTIGNGYIRINIGRKKWKYEHRLVMENYLHRPLKKTETIHHKNGNKLDNRIKNLELFKSIGQHTLIAHPEVLKKLNP